MQTVKRHFFAMRNGVIADVLRKAGSPFRIIFGLNLPQLVDIAEQTGDDAELARSLWANSTTRESMMLAPMIFPRAEMDRGEAERWIAAIPAAEIADVLCHRQLRYQPYAVELARDLVGSDKAMDRYTALRLMFNLVSAHPAEAAATAAAVAARPDALTDRVAAMLAEEASYMSEFENNGDFR